MFLSLVLSIVGLLKDVPKEKVDDFAFRLCYVFSSGVLFFLTMLLGLKDAFGKNIICDGNAMGSIRDQYCWVTATKPRSLNCDDGQIDQAVLDYFNGLGCYCNDGKWFKNNGSDCDVTHSYYMWIPYMLLLQGCLMYLPKIIWDYFEEGKMKAISSGIIEGTIMSENYEEKLDNVATNVSKYINSREGGHLKYGNGYLIAHALNICTVIFCIFLTDAFLDNQFATLGISWLGATYNEEKSSAIVLESIFPRTVSCNMTSYGTGGGLQDHDFLCVLAPNALSEKIFTFLWFWYGLLVLILSANFISIIFMAFKSVILRKAFLSRAVWTRKVYSNQIKENALDKTIGKLDFGRFLFLYFLASNVEYQTYQKILEALAGPSQMPSLQDIPTTSSTQTGSANAPTYPGLDLVDGKPTTTEKTYDTTETEL